MSWCCDVNSTFNVPTCDISDIDDLTEQRLNSKKNDVEIAWFSILCTINILVRPIRVCEGTWTGGKTLGPRDWEFDPAHATKFTKKETFTDPHTLLRDDLPLHFDSMYNKEHYTGPPISIYSYSIHQWKDERILGQTLSHVFGHNITLLIKWATCLRLGYSSLSVMSIYLLSAQ